MKIKSLNMTSHLSKDSIPDTKITRFGYVIDKTTISPETTETIKKELTVTPYIYGNFKKQANDFSVYVESGNYIGIPKYYGLEKFGIPLINRLETYQFPTFDMEYTSTLRPNQQIIVDKIFEGFQTYRGGLLIAGCGSGKTNMAIYIACKYKLKTLFIVHKTFLKQQVIDRILSTTNVERIGIIQQKKIVIDCPFVVGMVKSLATIDYDDKIFRDFGMIIIDEVHHMGAKLYSKVYQKMSAKYMLGISAEKTRNDRMYKIINWYMGPILHMEEQKPNEMVVVKKFFYKTSNRRRIKILMNRFNGEVNRSAMITNLVHIRRRNRFILKIIQELFDQGKNILCLSGRIKQVNVLYRLLFKNKYTKKHVSRYLGGMNDDTLARAATKQIILGTYNMAEEGLDISGLNVVILCTPKSAVKQSVGRILRKDVYEEHPIVVEIVDKDNHIFTRQSARRDAYYHKQHYNIQMFDVADYPVKNCISWNDKEEIRGALNKEPVCVSWREEEASIDF